MASRDHSRSPPPHDRGDEGNASDRDSGDAQLECELEGVVKAFSDHPFFEGLRAKAIGALARKSHRKSFAPASDAASLSLGHGIRKNGHRRSANFVHQVSVAPHEKESSENVLIHERRDGGGRDHNVSLWIVESGFVWVEERGERLGKIEAGGAFGDFVALGHGEQQPFTVTRGDAPMTAWLVPKEAITSVMKQYPDSRRLLEERSETQMKKVVGGRLTKLCFFSHCANKCFAQLLAKMEVKYAAKGTELCRAGHPVSSMTMIACGSVKISPLQHTRSIATPVQRSLTLHEVPPKRGTLGSAWEQESPLKHHACEDNRESAFGDASTLRTREILNDGGASSDTDMQTKGGQKIIGTKSISYMNVLVEDDGEGHNIEENLEGINDKTGNCEQDSDEASEEDFAWRATKPPRFKLPEWRPCLEPVRCHSEGVAGPDPLVFGDGALLGFLPVSPRHAVATSDCIMLVLSTNDFSFLIDRHPRERKRYELIAEAEYQEWKKCGIRRLQSVDMFSPCSADFLSEIARLVNPALYFPEDVLITHETLPGDLILLMSGSVEAVSSDETTQMLRAPQSFGSLEWLGIKCDTRWKVTATIVSQALSLCRDQILGVLERYPHESTAMVSHMLRHNGMTLYRSGFSLSQDITGKRSDGKDVRRSLWHLPFFSNFDLQLLEGFTRSLTIRKLVPGQQLFKGISDPDFLVVLLDGCVSVGDCRDGKEQRQAPIVVVGFNKHTTDLVHAKTVCTIHTISSINAQKLAKEFPQDMRRLIERLHGFQERMDRRVGRPWWCLTTSLRLQPLFKDCDQEFLQFVADVMTTEFLLPGEVVVQEGDRVDSTMLLDCGTAIVEKVDIRSLDARDRLAVLHDGNWIGELLIFTGAAKRKATIRASTVCKIMRLKSEAFVEILGRFPKERQRFREKAEHRLITVDAERLEWHNFFETFHHRFINLLRPKCGPRLFFAGETVMRQGEPADSLFLFGPDSSVTLYVDGHKVEDQSGRACMDVVALLSSLPVRRTCTVVCNTVCAVRSLTRADWLDSLKSYPEHRRWIQAFTEEQMRQINASQKQFMRTRAWEKIQERNRGARKLHCSRVGAVRNMREYRDLNGRSLGKEQQRRHPEQSDCEAQLTFQRDRGKCTPAGNLPPCPRATKSTEDSPTSSRFSPLDAKGQTVNTGLSLVSREQSCHGVMPRQRSESIVSKTSLNKTEHWPCFNVEVVPVPHTRLPDLGRLANQNHMESPRRSRDDVDTEEHKQDFVNTSVSQNEHRSSYSWSDCEFALGVRQ